MARPLRLTPENGIFHVFARGNDRKVIFRDDEDRQRFLARAIHVRNERCWDCLAFCLMGTHYHLLVRVPHGDLSAGMRDLNADYARTFNQRHGSVGHVFQGRFQSKLVDTRRYLITVARYIANNPVEARLVADPIEWPWSGHRELMTGIPGVLNTHAVLDEFDGDLEQRRRGYASFVATPDERDVSADVALLGDREFAAEHLSEVNRPYEVPRRFIKAGCPPLEDLPFANDLPGAIATAREHGYTHRDIAKHLGCHPNTITNRLNRLAL